MTMQAASLLVHTAAGMSLRKAAAGHIGLCLPADSGVATPAVGAHVGKSMSSSLLHCVTHAYFHVAMQVALDLSQLQKYTGRDKPTVIT